MPEENEFFDPELDGREGCQNRVDEDPFCLMDGDIQKIREDQDSIRESLVILMKDHVSLSKSFVFSLAIVGIFMLVMVYVYITDMKASRADRAELIQRLEVSSLKIWGLERELKLSSPTVCLRRFDEKVRDFGFGKSVTADMFIDDAVCALRAGATDEQIGLLVDHMVEHEIRLFQDYPFYEAFRQGKRDVVKIELTALIHRRVDYR